MWACPLLPTRRAVLVWWPARCPAGSVPGPPPKAHFGGLPPGGVSADAPSSTQGAGLRMQSSAALATRLAQNLKIKVGLSERTCPRLFQPPGVVVIPQRHGSWRRHSLSAFTFSLRFLPLCIPLLLLFSRSVVSDSLPPHGLTVACQAPLSLGILQVRILEWIAMPSSRGSSQPRDQMLISFVSCIGRKVLYHYTYC